MRRIAGVFIGIALASAGRADDAPPPHDAASWAKLIEAAKARGGAETKLDKSSSYVFQQENGDFITLTEWRSTPPKRFLCTIAKDQKATVCVRWETGQTTYGERADAASPWKTRLATSLEDTKESTPAGQLLGKIGDFIGGAMQNRKVH
jgi:hypothetical protein